MAPRLMTPNPTNRCTGNPPAQRFVFAAQPQRLSIKNGYKTHDMVGVVVDSTQQNEYNEIIINPQNRRKRGRSNMKMIRKTLASVGAAALMSTQAFAAAVNPGTGDNSILVPMLVVGGVALVAIIAFFLTGKKK